MSPTFEDAIEACTEIDSRYAAEAYRFVREALDLAVREAAEQRKGQVRHVTADELLDGVLALSVKEFGPLARRVLAHWGVFDAGDVGEVVFNLVQVGALGRTEQDRREDFDRREAWTDELERPFLPSRRRAVRRRSRARTPTENPRSTPS
jgi:uncharacterized repeat protein (TIGR04138 family)